MEEEDAKRQGYHDNNSRPKQERGSRVESRCLNLDQLHATRRSGLNGYSGLATMEVLGYQSNELLIGFAIDGR